MPTARTLLSAGLALGAIAYAQAESHAEVDCCSKKYPELANEPCDEDHYCNYVDWKEYNRIQTGGIIVTILLTGISVLTVLARDVMKVWTCFGITESTFKKPERQLTAMSAAYAEGGPQGNFGPTVFQNQQVPMGMMPNQQQYPQQPMYSQQPPFYPPTPSGVQMGSA